MNIQLSNTEEFVNREAKGTLGQVFIRYVECGLVFLGGFADGGDRCNNVLWIAAVPSTGDMKMED